MMNTKKPEPLYETAAAPVCPICGKKSYSPAGIHPQCAMQQADAPRQKKLAAAKKKAQQAKADELASKVEEPTKPACAAGWGRAPGVRVPR